MTRADLLPGDLVFLARDPADPATIHHVGLYVGDGLMVHAPRTGDVVRRRPGAALGLRRRRAGARAPCDGGDADVPGAPRPRPRRSPPTRRPIRPPTRPATGLRHLRRPRPTDPPTDAPTDPPTDRPTAPPTGLPTRRRQPSRPGRYHRDPALLLADVGPPDTSDDPSDLGSEHDRHPPPAPADPAAGATRRDGREPVTPLVRRAADGDQVAWDALVERYTNLVWSVARSYRLSSSDAADVVQTTWLRLVENLGLGARPGAAARLARHDGAPRVPAVLKRGGRELVGVVDDTAFDVVDELAPTLDAAMLRARARRRAVDLLRPAHRALPAPAAGADGRRAALPTHRSRRRWGCRSARSGRPGCGAWTGCARSPPPPGTTSPLLWKGAGHDREPHRRPTCWSTWEPLPRRPTRCPTWCSSWRASPGPPGPWTPSC